MNSKTKNSKTNSDQLATAGQQLGMVLMTLAATIGMIELPEHPNSKIVTPSQPVFAFAGMQDGQQDNPLRREREETGPHYISYGINQRTPGRTGKY